LEVRVLSPASQDGRGGNCFGLSGFNGLMAQDVLKSFVAALGTILVLASIAAVVLAVFFALNIWIFHISFSSR
jgi:hypothetical protein